jgi:hypothetical protein
VLLSPLTSALKETFRNRVVDLVPCTAPPAADEAGPAYENLTLASMGTCRSRASAPSHGPCARRPRDQGTQHTAHGRRSRATLWEPHTCFHGHRSAAAAAAAAAGDCVPVTAALLLLTTPHVSSSSSSSAPCTSGCVTQAPSTDPMTKGTWSRTVREARRTVCHTHPHATPHLRTHAPCPCSSHANPTAHTRTYE